MKIFKKKQKEDLPTMKEVETILERADRYSKALEKFNDAMLEQFPETEAQKQERLAFHEQVREAWGFDSNY